MKFKIGDKIKVKNLGNRDNYENIINNVLTFPNTMQLQIGKTFTINNILEKYCAYGLDGTGGWWHEKWLEPAQMPKVLVKDLL